MYMTCKHYLKRVLGYGKIKIGILGEKGFETRRFFSELMSVRLSEPSSSSKRACLVGSGHSSLERAVSELQAKGDEKLLEPGRSSEPDFA